VKENMTKNNQEIESKFYVQNLVAVEALLKTLGATCIVPRGFEYNLRFDNHQKSLQRQHKVLRLRKFDDIRLTFKGPGERLGGALSRTEIELIVNDFDQAQQFLESLGYHVAAVYEKYRAMYAINNAMVTLDELPYGKFVEIEAENPQQINSLARQLGLNPEAAIPASYQGLFEQVKAKLNLPVKNLAFWEFKEILISASDLGVQPADLAE
jgi:adenylate cyclase class 2